MCLALVRIDLEAVALLDRCDLQGSRTLPVCGCGLFFGQWCKVGMALSWEQVPITKHPQHEVRFWPTRISPHSSLKTKII